MCAFFPSVNDFTRNNFTPIKNQQFFFFFKLNKVLILTEIIQITKFRVLFYVNTFFLAHKKCTKI